MPKLRYSQSFKEQAIALALDGNKSSASVARDLGIKETTLYNWLSSAKNSNKNKKNVSSSANNNSNDNNSSEIKRLKKALARAEMERDILKKATAYFANQTL